MCWIVLVDNSNQVWRPVVEYAMVSLQVALPAWPSLAQALNLGGILYLA